ncbi:MAG: UDP-N-acetylmuramoyl-L-alanine--D-glutamate ligase [Gammaproteobacteria bacterium]|nr:UDP-N-acetylmuramoyl-L-alanine--D-glutamate ligase [Gammaproteobacteria bacterium]
MELIARNQRLIIGAGPTGLAIARHFTELGVHFAMADTRTDGQLLQAVHALSPNIDCRLGPLDPQWLTTFDEVVVSPGVPPTTPGLAEAEVPKISDIQLFRRAWPTTAPLVAITGSNAKSTVTTLVGDILQAAGRAAVVGGNLGPQALDLLGDAPAEAVAVLELSSFQLARTIQLQADVATVLNMSADHLDWHGSMVNYHRDKHRIFQGVKSIVVNAEDPLSQPLVPDHTPTTRFAVQSPDFHRFGILETPEGPWIACGTERWMPVSTLRMPSRHMLQNTMAACAIVQRLGVGPEAAAHAVAQFEGLSHRMQPVAERRGVLFIDDSKGTNVGASIAAMQSASASSRPLVLLAGGDAKGADASDWAQWARRLCVVVHTYGRDGRALAEAIGQTARVHSDLATAFAAAVADATPGSTVLLSPACASLDQYPNYMARGRHFIALVEALA